MEKVTRNKITKRELELILLGEIQSQTKAIYESSKIYIMQAFTKEDIEKVISEQGGFTKVEAVTATIEDLIKAKEEQAKKLQEEIKELKLRDKTEIVIMKAEYAKRFASKETKEKAKEYIDKMLEDFTSKTLKQ